MDVHFKQAKHELELMLPPQAQEVLGVLRRMQVDLQAALIVHELAPGRLDGMRVRDVMVLKDTTETNTIELLALSRMAMAFPVETDVMEEGLINLEEGEEFLIEPDLVGCWWSYDTFDYLLENPDEFNAGDSLLVMGKMMDTITDLRFWPVVGQQFGWPEGLAPRSASVAVHEFDREKFELLLEERGLDEFLQVFEIVWMETDCVFLDANRDDISCLPPFSVEGVRWCLAEWEKGKPYVEMYNKAMEKVQKNPGILLDVVRAWDDSCIFGEGRPRTLMEIFDPQPGGPTDEFYGAIGVETDEEEWE